jgi:hypothetical protein
MISNSVFDFCLPKIVVNYALLAAVPTGTAVIEKLYADDAVAGGICASR